MADMATEYRVQYWGTPKETQEKSHCMKKYQSHSAALVSYIRNIEDAAIGILDISYIKLEQRAEEGWNVLCECELTFRGNVTKKSRKQRRDYIVKSWKKENPNGTKTECARDTGLKREVIKKWWD